jgi:hypothetical protein
MENRERSSLIHTSFPLGAHVANEKDDANAKGTPIKLTPQWHSHQRECQAGVQRGGYVRTCER